MQRAFWWGVGCFLILASIAGLSKIFDPRASWFDALVGIGILIVCVPVQHRTYPDGTTGAQACLDRTGHRRLASWVLLPLHSRRRAAGADLHPGAPLLIFPGRAQRASWKMIPSVCRRPLRTRL